MFGIDNVSLAIIVATIAVIIGLEVKGKMGGKVSVVDE